MAHTLVVYIFNIFAVFVKAAKIPKVIREFKCSNVIKFKYFRMARIMTDNMMEQLNLCIVTCSPNIIFHSAPLTLKSFCPDLVREESKTDSVVDRKRTFDKVNGDKHKNNNNNNGNSNVNYNITKSNNNNNVNQGKNGTNNTRPSFTGSIINKTGNKIHFPGYLKKKYCANFADTEETCNRGTSCLFEHALFPSGYHEDDIAPMIKFIDDSKDLAWHANVTVPVSSKK